nr:hypothetical protein [uncultured bacterium]
MHGVSPWVSLRRAREVKREDRTSRSTHKAENPGKPIRICLYGVSSFSVQ